MPAPHRITAGAGLTVALLATPLAPAAAEATMAVTSGGSYQQVARTKRGQGFRTYPRTYKRHGPGGYKRHGHGGAPRAHKRHLFEMRPPHGFGAYDRFPYSTGKGYGKGFKGYDRHRKFKGYDRHRKFKGYDRHGGFKGHDRRKGFKGHDGGYGAYPGGGKAAPGFGKRCRIVKHKTWDRHGRVNFVTRTLCHDRYGRPYIVGRH